MLICDCPECKAASAKKSANAPLTALEREFVVVLGDVWERQVKAAARTLDLQAITANSNLIDLDKWDEEVAELTFAPMLQALEQGGNEGLRELLDMLKRKSLSGRRAVKAAVDEVVDSIAETLIGMDIDPAIVAGLAEWIDLPTSIDAARAECYKFAHEINQVTADKLRSAIVNGLDEGETLAQIKQRVLGVTDAFRDGKRADMIARTEVSRANGLGKVEAWKSSGLRLGKEWKVTSTPCPFCDALDGEIVEALDEPYFEEGSSQTVEFQGRELRLNHNYGAISAPPLHPNCDCTIVPVVLDQ